MRNFFGKITPVLILLLSIGFVGCAQAKTNAAHQRGMELFKKNMFREAIGEFGKAAEFDPKSAEVLYDRGRTYDALGDAELAIADYTRAIELNSAGCIQASYNNRGLAYQKIGNTEKAIEDFTKGIQAMPDPKFSGFRYFKSVLHRNRAELYRQRKMFDQALEDARAIENLGGSVEPEFIKKLNEGDFSVINLPESSGPEAYPGARSEASLYNNRGFASFRAGKYGQAIEDYDRSIRIISSDPLVFANRANAYTAIGNSTKAIEDYRKALELNPDDDNIYHDLGSAYTKMGDFDNALLAYEKSLEKNPDLEEDGQFHNDRAVVYFWRKEYGKSSNDIEKALKLGYRVNPEFIKALKEAINGSD